MLKYLILLLWSILQVSCAREGALPYHPPEFAPMYREECYAEHKNWLCMDKDEDKVNLSYPMGILLFMGSTIEEN
tara:strand:- start:297 stop:521 length:225 start_codon:yes stop_codon:yes gene_type:complete